jgi:hypothetical protein
MSKDEYICSFALGYAGELAAPGLSMPPLLPPGGVGPGQSLGRYLWVPPLENALDG